MIDLSEVLNKQNITKTYEVCLEADTFDYKNGSYPITDRAPVLLKIVSPQKNKISLSGSLSLHLSIPCDRCLTPVDCEITCDIERDYVIGGEEDEETEVLDSTELDVERLLYSEILMNLPGKVLCREDCKGICTVCGRNLNEGECGCDRQVLDPRMAAVLDVFHNFDKND